MPKSILSDHSHPDHLAKANAGEVAQADDPRLAKLISLVQSGKVQITFLNVYEVDSHTRVAIIEEKYLG